MLKRHIQQPFQHLRLLRAGDGLLSCDDKAGHAIDPQPMCAEVFGMHRLSFLTGTQEGQRRMRVKADPPSHSRKSAGIANIHTIGEIGIKQRFHHHLAQAFPHCITHQAMRIDAGWYTPHQVKAKTDSLGSAKIRQGILQAPRAILTTEFPRDEFCTGNAAWGNIGIQQKRPPDQFWNDIRPGPQGTAQPPDAQVAPGADQVEGDFNIQPRLEGCQDIHTCSLAQPHSAGSPFFGS